MFTKTKTKNFNKELRSFYKQKDVNGFNILHQCCARGANELLAVALSNEKCLKYLNTRDNYGRTPLFWSFWSGNWKTAVMVMSKGGRLNVQDNVGDLPFHIGVAQDQVEAMKTLMFVILKKDSEERTLSHLLLKTLQTKNMKGLTPSAFAKVVENKEAFSLLTNMEKLCQQRIYQAGATIKEIVMRSGIYNGKGLSENSNINKAKVNMFNSASAIKGLIIDLEMKDMTKVKVTLPLSQFAFLILERTQKRIEMTLLKAPKVEYFNTVDKKWEVTEKTLFTDSLSFHCYLNSSSHLETLNTYINSSKNMNEFQNYCYSYIPESVEKKESTPKVTMKKQPMMKRSRSNSPKSKMSALRMKMNGMSISSYNLKSTNSYQDVQRMLFANKTN